jgi:phage-related tail fiber protein
VWNGATFTIVSFRPSSSIITNPAATAPSSPVLGQLWQDTSQTPDELKMYDGSGWVRVDPDGITQTAADARYLQITAAASTYLALSGGTLTGNLTLVGAPTTDNMASTKKYVDDQIAAIPGASDPTPAGTIIYSARSTAPTGYLKANGAAVSRTTYATLFAAIGTTYGAGNGSTTFNLPDLRGEFIRGFDDGRDIDSGRTLGSSQGDATALPNNAFTTSNPGNHNHSYRNTASDNIAGIGDNRGYISSDGTGSSTGFAGSHTHTIGGGDIETRPRNVALLACIKT